MGAAPYYIVAGLLAIAALSFPRRPVHPGAWAVAFLALVVFVGLRHHVGMDWNNYVRISDWMKGASLQEAFDRAEPAFAILSWSSTRLGTGIYGVHLVGATIFFLGLFRLCRQSPNPWLGLLVAFPILITAVATSASRQMIAIGILMWLVSEWKTASLQKRMLLILFAATFHYSASFMLIFAALELKVGKKLKAVIVVLLAVLTVMFMQVSGGGDYYLTTYVTEQDELTFSPGAIQHILLNALPASLVIFGRRVRAELFPSALLWQMGLLAVILVPIAVVASVAAGRISLYLFPVSICALSALPSVFGTPQARAVARFLIALAMMTTLWIWLTFSNSAYAHIPYRNVIFVHPTELEL